MSQTVPHAPADRAPIVVGRVAQLWRYPLKSAAGERLPAAEVTERGLLGDRGWCLRDERRGALTGGKRIPAIMTLAARYRAAPTAGAAPPPIDITLPSGAVIGSDDADAAARLSDALGRPVTLWPLRPASDHHHYARSAPLTGREVRDLLGIAPGDPLPDLSLAPPDIEEMAAAYETAPGTYFDAADLHIVTTAALDQLRAFAPASDFDPRRFRPNIVVETAPAFSGHVEQGWVGRTLMIGATTLDCFMPTLRCSMPSQPQPGLPRDGGVARAVSTLNGAYLGAYLRPTRLGAIAVGDPVYLTALASDHDIAA